MPAFLFTIIRLCLTVNLIREKRDFVIERLKVKNFDAASIVDKIIALDTNRRETQTTV